MHSYGSMFLIMVLSGFLSTMNVWVDKVDDIRFSLNDLYMTLLMTGWMFLGMGVMDRDPGVFMVGVFLVLVNIACIRTQFLITETQYALGMIPHHSMAVHMSRELLKKEKNPFVQHILETQEREIEILKG